MAENSGRGREGRHEAPEHGEAGGHAKPRGDHAAGPDRRRSRPEALSILIEFAKMSRTSAILLIAFLLTAALYMVVRQDPVVAFGSPPGPAPTRSESTEVDVPGSDEQPTTQQPVGTTVTSGPEATTGTSDAATSVSAGPRRAESGEPPTGEQTQQTSAPLPAPGGQAPQQANPSEVPTP